MGNTVTPTLNFPLLIHITAADKSSTVDPTSNWGTWEGWGVSLAWWAKAFGDRDDLATIFFSADSKTLNGQNLPGLWFNIVRYNAGAGSSNSIDGSRMVVSPNILPSRQMDGFWMDWASSNTSSSSWDWTVDKNQRSMLLKALDRGANIFELFSNSPMWWMCKNHNPSGSDGGTTDNLQSWNYGQHAVYLASIAKYARDNWGINFNSADALNEPSTNYWKSDGTQEGCHFEVATQGIIIKNMRNELDKRGLAAVAVSASDETSYDDAVATWDSLGSDAKAKVNRINVHGYQGGGGRRDELEYGDGDGSGKGLYQNLLLDLKWLHPTAWVYWQAVDIQGWGLIVGNNDKKTLGSATQKYFVLAQFTRHIRPGMQILSASDVDSIAAYDAETNKLIIVAANWGNAQYLNFDLSMFNSPGQDGSLVPRWSTQTGGGESYVNHQDTFLKGKRFWSWFESGTVQTFEVSNVS
ncbi:family 5 glycoside hydrolase [Fusarium oxysporum]|nr:family 5 glycoside hydrolase [Fusarium oxysporum]